MMDGLIIAAGSKERHDLQSMSIALGGPWLLLAVTITATVVWQFGVRASYAPRPAALIFQLKRILMQNQTPLSQGCMSKHMVGST